MNVRTSKSSAQLIMKLLSRSAPQKNDFASKVVVYFNVMPTSKNQAINIEILLYKTAAYMHWKFGDFLPSSF